MIPKKIHYCWFGGAELPDEYKKYIESWREKCPDYEIIQWNELNYDVNINQYMKEAYESKKYGFVSDYARLDIVYNEGGIYLDTDIELLKSFDNLLNLDAFCGLEKSSKFINSGLGFGASKGNKIIKMMRDQYVDLNFVQNGKMNLLPCPETNTRPLYKLGYKYTNGTQELEYQNSKLTIFSEDYFCPKDYMTGKTFITDNTISIHHYSGSWQSKESYEIRKLGEKYSKKYGNILGIKVAKLIWYTKNEGIGYIPMLTLNFIKNRIAKIYRKRKSRRG